MLGRMEISEQDKRYHEKEEDWIGLERPCA